MDRYKRTYTNTRLYHHRTSILSLPVPSGLVSRGPTPRLWFHLNRLTFLHTTTTSSRLTLGTLYLYPGRTGPFMLDTICPFYLIPDMCFVIQRSSFRPLTFLCAVTPPSPSPSRPVMEVPHTLVESKDHPTPVPETGVEGHLM